MQAYACGYLGQHSDISTSFRALTGSEAQTSLVPGGWGCFGLISHGLMHLYAAQPRVSQQQLTQLAATLPAIALTCNVSLQWFLEARTWYWCCLQIRQLTNAVQAYTLPNGLQPVVLDVPEGSATAAALGWGTIAALAELGAQAGGQAGCQAGGQLYECHIASIQTADSSSQAICQQTHSMPITWSKVQLLRPVTAVALGEYHR